MDVAIVGAGIAGLYTAVELAKQHPKLRIAVYEKYKALGGRATTYHTDVPGQGHLFWEAGAGRISEAHHRVLALMKRYKLKWIPIGSGVQYKASTRSEFEANAFEPGIPAFIDPLTSLPKEDLQKGTIRQLLTKIHGARKTEEYLIRFPYRAEVETLRADEALKVFQSDMRTHAGYGICAEGISEIVEGLRKEAERKGVEILPHHELVAVTERGSSLHFKKGKPSEGPAREDVTVTAKRVILAIPSADAEKIPGVSSWPGFKHLKMAPLVRIFSVFDEDWYKKYAAGGVIVTADPIRFVIPGDGKYVQISYTDSQDAEHWAAQIKAKGDEKVGQEIVSNLRKLLDPSIPSPLFTKSHIWTNGTTYWLPGRYDPAALSRGALTPFPETAPTVHLCGESYSLRQAWMEGALEHAEQLLKLLNRKLD
jgi:monoamine oxidase